MALVVEDGTGLANAESYVSVAYADQHCVRFGHASWAALTETAKEVALRKATRYIDGRYRFLGRKLFEIQALQWPRETLSEDWRWPVRKVQEATVELAVKAAASALYVDQSPNGVRVEQVGPIRTEYDPQRFGGQTRYAEVDEMLAEYVGGGRGTLTLERAN